MDRLLRHATSLTLQLNSSAAPSRLSHTTHSTSRDDTIIGDVSVDTCFEVTGPKRVALYSGTYVYKHVHHNPIANSSR